MGIEPRVELDGAERHVLGPQVLDGGDHRPGGVEARLGLVPVGGAVVGPVRGLGGEGVGPAAGADGAGPLEEDPAPFGDAGPGAVAGDHREVGGEAGGHRGEVAVPPAADGAAVEAHRLVVEGVERGEQQRAAIGCGEHQGPPGRGPVGEQEEAVEVGVGVRREAELAVLEGEGAQAVGRAAVGSVGGREDRPPDRGLVERPGGEVGDVGQRLGAEDDQRAIGVGAHRAADGTVVHDRHRGRRCRGRR